ncbi:MAG: hypothetical protein ACXWIU_05235 [Limisphaerales bacterium]
MAETQPQLQPALPRLSAMISQYFLLILGAGRESMDAAWFQAEIA